MIAQVNRYPANDRWIAISTDAYNQLGAEGEALHRDCHKQGIGLLRVSSGGKVTILSCPTPQPLPNGYNDFLSCYAGEKAMRNELEAAAVEPAE